MCMWDGSGGDLGPDERPDVISLSLVFSVKCVFSWARTVSCYYVGLLPGSGGRSSCLRHIQEAILRKCMVFVAKRFRVEYNSTSCWITCMRTFVIWK